MGEGHRRAGVIYDVDGTLLDTNYLHVTAWWDAFRERGHDVACADIHRAMGLSSDDLISRVLGEPDPSVSSGDVKQAKPDPEIVQKALADSGTDPARAVMVGDTVWDVLAAERAGLRCVGLLSGGISEAELRDAGAIETFADPAALLDRLTGSAIGALSGSRRAPSAGQPGGGLAARR